MKQLFLIAAIIFSSVVNGQTSKDTTNKKIKVPVDTAYILSGKVPDFQLLYRAINTPGSVTRDEINILVQWLQQIQMIEVPKKPKQ
jgi:hypothetical protein